MAPHLFRSGTLEIQPIARPVCHVQSTQEIKPVVRLGGLEIWPLSRAEHLAIACRGLMSNKSFMWETSLYNTMGLRSRLVPYFPERKSVTNSETRSGCCSRQPESSPTLISAYFTLMFVVLLGAKTVATVRLGAMAARRFQIERLTLQCAISTRARYQINETA